MPVPAGRKVHYAGIFSLLQGKRRRSVTQPKYRREEFGKRTKENRPPSRVQG